jgi:hypothetical protein
MVARSIAAAAGVVTTLASTVFVSCRARMASMPMSKIPVEQVAGIGASGLRMPNCCMVGGGGIPTWTVMAADETLDCRDETPV